MAALVAITGLALIVVILWDAFESIVLPRRVTRQFRLTRIFYRATWKLYSALARRMRSNKRREKFLSFYGPLSLLMLLIIWAMVLILGFAMLQWAAGSALRAQETAVSFATDFYMSGTTFFTLGLGDVVPRSTLARFLTVVESGTGFGFLALVIGYLPVIYQAFSRREANISLLDARAGSPSTAFELLRRHADGGNHEALKLLLSDWELWSAELMESHLSYPVLGYYRSQHDNQSWLGALTTILDTCALVMAGIDGMSKWQAQLTFAMARHAVVDLSQIFNTPPRPPAPERLSLASIRQLRSRLMAEGVVLEVGSDADHTLAELRRMYEPYVNALGDYLLMNLPAWMPEAKPSNNWQTSAWERSSAGAGRTALEEAHKDEHF
jgi:hypothetical protein